MTILDLLRWPLATLLCIATACGTSLVALYWRRSFITRIEHADLTKLFAAAKDAHNSVVLEVALVNKRLASIEGKQNMATPTRRLG